MAEHPLSDATIAEFWPGEDPAEIRHQFDLLMEAHRRQRAAAAVSDDYPEHEKLKGLGGSNQIVGDFIEWLGEQRIELAKWNPSGLTLFPLHKSRDDLLADFFEIDRDRLEAEKRAMLAKIREPAG